jgi:membrane protein
MVYLKRLFGKFFAAYSHYSSHDGPLLAAAIAYYLAFSLFPLMLVLVAVLGWAFGFTAPGQKAEQRVLQAVSEQVSPALSDQLAAALGSVERNAAASGAFGVVLLLAAAIAIFTQIDYAFDRIWEDSASASRGWRDRAKHLVITRLKAVLMLLGVGAFVLAVMIASIVWQGVRTNLSDAVELAPIAQRLVQLLAYVEPLVHVGLNILAFAVVYRFLPKGGVRWGSALLGAVTASVLWEIGRQVLAAYVVGNKLPTAYGLIGSFMAVMLWTYYAMIVVLYGAAYTRVLDQDSPRP